MTKANVVKFRDEAKVNAQTLIIYLDNGRYVNEGLAFTHWDDTAELLTVVEMNADNPYSQKDAPMQVLVEEYSNIQSLSALYRVEKLDGCLTLLGFSVDDIAKINEFEKHMFDISTTYDDYPYTTSDPQVQFGDFDIKRNQ